MHSNTSNRNLKLLFGPLFVKDSDGDRDRKLGGPDRTFMALGTTLRRNAVAGSVPACSPAAVRGPIPRPGTPSLSHLAARPGAARSEPMARTQALPGAAAGLPSLSGGQWPGIADSETAATRRESDSVTGPGTVTESVAP